MSDQAILGREEVAAAVASVTRLLGVRELVDSQDGELSKVCRTECALIGLLIGVSSHVDL